MEIKDLPEELQITPLTAREKYCYFIGQMLGAMGGADDVIKLQYKILKQSMESMEEATISSIKNFKNQLMPLGVGQYKYPEKPNI